VNSDCADENRSHHGKSEVLRWLVKTYTMMIIELHHLRIGDASVYYIKYAMSTAGREITFLSSTYQIDHFEFMDPSAPVFSFPIRRKHVGM
jgi:hypothetical protein